MKNYDTQFEDYLHKLNAVNLHPKLKAIYDRFPSKIQALQNIIFYGPPGVGKYSQMLSAIQKYSPTCLKYDKKTNIEIESEPYSIKISDIHYEIDMAQLGYNSKQIWHELYLLIVDIVSTKQNKHGIIVCKNFHEIDKELLDVFYSYIQQNFNWGVQLTFILLTESCGFINDEILNCCGLIRVPRPSKTNYKRVIQYNNRLAYATQIVPMNVSTIHNIQFVNDTSFIIYYNLIDKLIDAIINNKIQFTKFRDGIYDIMIYNINIYNCIEYILHHLIQQKQKEYIHYKNVEGIIQQSLLFFKQYNNNYRPIFHIENYLLFLVEMIHNK